MIRFSIPLGLSEFVNGLLQRADFPVIHRGHGDDLLREHVERVARDA